MPETKRASLTIKSRTRADGSVSRWLYIRPTPPDGKSLIPVPKATKPTDRAIAEEFAKPYRKVLAKGLSEPQPETCDEYFKRWNAMRRAKSPRQADADEAAFRLHVASEIGAIPLRGVMREPSDDIRRGHRVVVSRARARHRSCCERRLAAFRRIRRRNRWFRRWRVRQSHA